MVSRDPKNLDGRNLKTSVDRVDDGHAPDLEDQLERRIDLHDSAASGGVLPVVYMEEILADREENLLDVPTGCLLDQSVDGVEVELLRLLGVVLTSGIPAELTEVGIE